MGFASLNPSGSVCRERVVKLERQQNPATCVLASQTKVFLPHLLVPYVAAGDEIVFPVSPTEIGEPEIYLRKKSGSGRTQCLYLVPSGHVSQPRQDKRNQHFVSAGIQHGTLGFNTVILPSNTLREYFYRIGNHENGTDHRGLYDALGIPANVSLLELRVAFKLRNQNSTANALLPRSHRTPPRLWNVLNVNVHCR